MIEARISTGYWPHKYQVIVHKALAKHRFAVIVAHRRWGKSVLAVNELIDRALRDDTGSGRYGYMAPFLKQSKDIAWSYLKQFTRHLPMTKINESELSVILHNGSFIRLYGADNPDSIRGTYFSFIVLDELSDVKPEVWQEVIRPALADRKGGALMLGTPKGQNLLSELFFGDQPDWYRAMFRADETDIVDPAELEASRQIMSESQFAQEWLCSFEASNDNILIPISLASEAARRIIPERDIRFAPKIIGVDVARYGGDRSCVMFRQGLQAFDPLVFQGIDNMTLAGKVAREIDAREPDAVFVDAGRGEGVIDRLRQLGYRAVEVNFGGKPDDPGFTNKRAEMWKRMADWLHAGGAVPNHPDLKTDLAAPTYSYANAAGKFDLESKDKLRERGLRSPDVGDALALTFAYPVAAANGARRRASRPARGALYDPHETFVRKSGRAQF